jgi:NitT/TauT family transport system permease protein
MTRLAPLVLAIIIIAGWWLTSSLGRVPQYYLPSPLSVANELGAGLIHPGDLWSAIAVTACEALLGSLAGFVLALPLAVLVYRSRLVSSAVLPFLGATQAIPAVALAPLLALWIGFGLGSIVALCALMVFFPILVSSVVGFRHIDRRILGAAQLDGAGSWSLLIHMEIPLALANILAGTRNGFTLSVTGAVVGEMMLGGAGLGSLISSQAAAFNTAGMFAAIIVLAAMAALVYSAISLAERRWSGLTSTSRDRQVNATSHTTTR